MTSKVNGGWYSHRLDQFVNVVRYGHAGQPVLLFPTAGGDAEESERFRMMVVLGPLLDAGLIRVYTCDSVSGRAWIDGELPAREKPIVQNRFDAFVYREFVPAIRTDCREANVEIVAAGSSIGAFNALAILLRHPDVFKSAVCMSGTYDFSRFMQGTETPEYHEASPMHFFPTLPDDSETLRRLRTRFVLLATGEGRFEAPQESWAVGQMLGGRGVPNRVDFWGKERQHDWNTWRAMLPDYLGRLTREGRL